MTTDWDAFDAGLDEYQEREREAAFERELLGDEQAVRPDAERATVTVADLNIGDFMTAEDGPHARWVKVVEIKEGWRDPAKTSITFQTPQPIGVGLVDRWVIERDPADPVVIDQRVRANAGGVS